MAAALPATALPVRVAELGEQPIEAEVVDTTLPKPRSKPARLSDRELPEGEDETEAEAEEYHDYDSEERQRPPRIPRTRTRRPPQGPHQARGRGRSGHRDPVHGPRRH